MDRTVAILDTILAALAGLLFGALFLITVLNIVLRNVGGVTWLWIPGMTKLLFIWTVFTGTAVLYQRNDHLVMDFFSSKFSPERRRVLEIIKNLVLLMFLIVLVIYGFIVVEIRLGIPFETWNLSTAYAFLAAPVSAILMVFFCANKLRKLFKGEIIE